MIWVTREISSVNDNRLGGFSSDHFKQGWAGWMTPQVEMLYEKGFRYLFFHRPFGEIQYGGRMAMDSRVQLASHHLNQEYPFWQAEMLERFPELNIVGYVGSAKLSLTMESMLNDGDVQGWIDTAIQSVQPFLNHPRTHVAIDWTSKLRNDDYAWHIVPLLRWLFHRTGKRDVFVEAIPKKTQEHQKAFKSIIVEGAYQANLPQISEYNVRPGSVRWYNRSARYNSKLWLGEYNEFIKDCKVKSMVPAIDYTLIDWENSDVTNVVGK